MTAESRKPTVMSTRRERKAQRTRNRILDAAKTLFENQPYENVKMEDISEQVDLSRATLYNYFGSKEAIYFEIGVQEMRRMRKSQRNAITGDGTGLEKLLVLSEDALRRLIEEPIISEIIRRYLVANAQAETPSHVVVGRMIEGEEVEDAYSVILASFLEGMREFEETWVAVIREGYDDGSIRHDLSPEQLTHLLFMVILGMIDRINLEKIVLGQLKLTDEHIVQLTVDMIRKYLTN